MLRVGRIVRSPAESSVRESRAAGARGDDLPFAAQGSETHASHSHDGREDILQSSRALEGARELRYLVPSHLRRRPGLSRPEPFVVPTDPAALPKDVDASRSMCSTKAAKENPPRHVPSGRLGNGPPGNDEPSKQSASATRLNRDCSGSRLPRAPSRRRRHAPHGSAATRRRPVVGRECQTHQAVSRHRPMTANPSDASGR